MSRSAKDTSDSMKGVNSELQGVFLRKATGLVRQISLTDSVLMNTIGMNIGIGAGLMFIWAPYLFLGGNVTLSVILATVITALTIAYVYSQLSAAMPRSGGDYVFVSRILHPAAGFLLSWSQTVWLFFWIGFNAWAPAAFVIPTALNIIGNVTGNGVYLSMAVGIATPLGMILTGTLVNAIFTVLLIFGNQKYFKWQKYAFFFAILSIVIAIILLFACGNAFPQAWNSFVTKSGSGLKYNDVIQKAASLGLHTNVSFSMAATLAMMPFAFWSVGFCQGSAQIGGEVKHSAKTQYIAMVIAVLVNGLVLALMGIALMRAAGLNFITSLGFLNFEHASVLGLKVQPYYNLMASVLTKNIFVVILIGIGYVAWAINGTPLSMLQATRYMLAWSFDRVTPPKLAEVSDKYHTPVYGIILCAVMGEVSLIILTFVAQASLLSALVAQIVAYMLVAIAGIIFPYKMKEVYKSSIKKEIFGIPLITISGIGMFAFLALMLYYFMRYSAFGANSPVSLIICGIIFGLGAIYYFVYKYIQKKNNIDISKAYEEIPPE
jgi:amino acid transporter